MSSKPHSQTVRGTLSNPKTEEAKAQGGPNRSQLGDHVSLKAETSNNNPTKDSKGATEQEIPAAASVSGDALSKPHSQKVRGTLDNPKTDEARRTGAAEKTQLGDHTSIEKEKGTKSSKL